MQGVAVVVARLHANLWLTLTDPTGVRCYGTPLWPAGTGHPAPPLAPTYVHPVLCATTCVCDQPARTGRHSARGASDCAMPHAR